MLPALEEKTRGHFVHAARRRVDGGMVVRVSFRAARERAGAA